MQGRRSSVSTLAENLSFDHAAMSGDTSIESQMSWSNNIQTIQTSAQNRLSAASMASAAYLRRVRTGGLNAQSGSGETSSAAAQNHGHGNEGKTEQHSRSSHPRAGLTMVERQYEPSNVISVENDKVDWNGNQATTGSFVLQNSGSVSQDLNMSSAQNQLPEYRSAASRANAAYLRYVRNGGLNAQSGSGETSSAAASMANAAYLRYVRHGGLNAQSGSGETSSAAAQNHSHENEGKTEQRLRSSHPRAGLTMVERQYEPSNVISVENDKVDLNENQATTGSIVLQNSGSVSQDLNMISGFGDDDEDDDCQIVERPSTFASVGSSSVLGNEGRPGCSLDGRRTSSKRKASELQVGESSGAGSSSNYLQNAEIRHWVPIPAKTSGVQIGQSSGAGSSNHLPNEKRYLWEPIPAKPSEVQVGQTSRAGSSNSLPDEKRYLWEPIPPKSSEVQVGQSSGAGSSNYLQNEKRYLWEPIPAKSSEMQVGQSSGGASSNSLQNAERYLWEPVSAKSSELQVGQSSGIGSSNSQNAERSHWVPLPDDHIDSSNVSIPTQNEAVSSNSSDHANPRLRLGLGGAVSAGPFSLTSSGNPESSRRNIRVRINRSPYQDPIASHPFGTEVDVGNRDIPSTRHSARLLRNNVLDLNPVPPVENNGSPHEQYTASVRRNTQTRWSRASSSRNTRSSIPAIPEPTATNVPIPRSISEHPIFVPAATEMGSSSEHPTGWNVAGENNTTVGNVSASAAGSSSGVNLSGAAAWSHRSRQDRPRRLAEIVRRSALLAAASESGSQEPNPAIGSSSSLTPEEMALLSGSHLHDRVATSSRSAMLERNLDLPYTLRNLATASEGRSSIMSEIRHVLNLMRRGEGLRIEDVMLLDHSVFLGMADMHDRHRDMRLDVDNMSYEELLALEERIGNVCTGLNEETIMNGLKQHKYVENGSKDQVDTEPCSICREEYNIGEDLGTLECGHDFHRDCIKQWLVQKNSCPICKKTGLST